MCERENKQVPTGARIECGAAGIDGEDEFHRGRVVEGNWILGMIDINTKEVRMVICPNN